MTEQPAITDRKPQAVPNLEELLDEWLVTRIWNGDRKAQMLLAKRWQPRLARTARRLLGDEDAALAAVQECWIAILRGIPSLADPARFRPWAFTILRRRCADHIRRMQSKRERDGGELDEGSYPSVAADTGDSLAILQAFGRLPADQRLAAQLFFVEELTLSEIAEVQSVPTGTVKSRIFHARQKLKAALAE